MNASILNRLKDLEKRYVENHIIVLAETETGEQVILPLLEFIEKGNLQMKRFLKGNSLKEFDSYIKFLKERALKEYERQTKHEREGTC